MFQVLALVLVVTKALQVLALVLVVTKALGSVVLQELVVPELSMVLQVVALLLDQAVLFVVFLSKD